MPTKFYNNQTEYILNKPLLIFLLYYLLYLLKAFDWFIKFIINFISLISLEMFFIEKKNF